MTTYNTKNPVPSADARDRYDNSQVFDELMNGTAPSTPDRLGVLRQSWAGMEQAFAGSEADRAAAFQAFLDASGWSTLGDYAAGISIISHTQTVDYEGQPYQLKPSVPASIDAPYITTGDWATEGVNFKLVGDNSLRQDLAASDGAKLSGFKSPIALAVQTNLDEVGRRSVSVFEFFTDAERADVKNLTLAVDVSAAIQRALDSMTGYATANQKSLRFPWGAYRCDDLLKFQDFKDVTIFMEGARFFAFNSAPIDGLLTIQNTDNFRILGAFSGHGQNKLNVETLMRLTVKLPSEGIPGKGLCVRTYIENFTGYGAKNVIHCGTYDRDDLVSEVVLSGIQAFNCTGVLRVSGSQTIIDVVNSQITSEPNAVLNDVPGTCVEYAVWMEGGNITVRGGEITHLMSVDGYTFRLNPCESAAFGSPWPSVSLVGVHVEIAAFMAYAVNERGIGSTTTDTSIFSMTECKGYISSSMLAQPIFAANTGSGVKFKLKSSNLYSNVARTAFNFDIADGCTVDVDSQSCGANLKHWLGGTRGGKTIHSPLVGVSADNLNNQSIAIGQTSALKWAALRTNGVFERYDLTYDGATGQFITPAGGASQVTVSAKGRFSAAPTSALPGGKCGYVAILKDGVQMEVVSLLVTDSGFSIEYTDLETAAGTLFTVQLTNQGTSAIAFGSAGYDTLQVEIGTLP